MPSSNSTKYVVTIVVLVIFLISSLGFGFWAFSQMNDYKNHSDKKSAQAVAAAKTQQKAELDAQYAEQSKQPFRTYKGPQTYGAVTFNYPKTWSALIDESDASQPIEGYFYPNVLPKLDDTAAMALRVELVDSDYASAIQGFDSQITDGTLRATTYSPPKMVGVANFQPGLRLDGALTDTFTGAMVILKVRDKTLEVSTQSTDFLNDFNNTILPSLAFLP